MKKEFEIKSSNGVTSYAVEFVFDAGKLYVFCACPAGVLGKWCKHKRQLMTGDMSGACGKSGTEDIVELQNWIGKSAFARMLAEMKLAEDEKLEAEIKLKRVKAELEKATQKGIPI